jgi:hypothetical protein
MIGEPLQMSAEIGADLRYDKCKRTDNRCSMMHHATRSPTDSHERGGKLCYTKASAKFEVPNKDAFNQCKPKRGKRTI